MNDPAQNVYSPPGEGPLNPSQVDQGFGRFDLSRAMTLGMDAYKQYVGLGVGTTVVWLLLFIVCYFLLMILVGIFLMPVLAIGPTFLGLYMVRRRAEFGVLFKGFDAYGRVLGAAALLFLFFLPFVVVAVGPVVGAFAYLGMTKTASAGKDPSMGALAVIGLSYMFIFLLVPFVYYAMGRLILVFPLIVERGYGSMQAIRTSWKVTAPYQWWLMLFMFITQIVGQMGVYLCGIGMFFTLPMSQAFNGAAIYMLLGEDEGQQAAATVPAGPATPVPPEEAGPAPAPDPYS